jgi:hypothetical protein
MKKSLVALTAAAAMLLATFGATAADAAPANHGALSGAHRILDIG